LVAWSGFGAGVGVLLVLLLNSSQSGIPGWQPANEALRATLSFTEATAPLPTRSSAVDKGGGSVDTHAAQDPPATGSPSSAAATAPPDSASQTEETTGEPPSVSPNDVSRLDLNRATMAELDDLPGIGPSKAQAIAELRDSRKGFRTAEELLEV